MVRDRTGVITLTRRVSRKGRTGPLFRKWVEDVALLMPKTGSMSSSFRRSYFLIIIYLVTVTALSAQAQPGNEDRQLANISRVCLWNADHSTWKTLGLKRWQIARMNELRLLYPAVVGGQWVVDEDDLPPVLVEEHSVRLGPDTRYPNTVGAGAAAQESRNEPRTRSATIQPVGLQHDLREVLTPVQLRSWARRCPQ